MNRISIDVTPEQHQRIKALAALCGQSIKEFVLSRTLGARGDDDPALAELEELLDERLRRLRASGPSARTVDDVFRQVRNEPEARP